MCYDNSSLYPYFPSTVDYINDSFSYNMNVLLHCKEGDSKSATLAIAYLMYKYKVGWQKACDVVRSRRSSIVLTEQQIFEL